MVKAWLRRWFSRKPPLLVDLVAADEHRVRWFAYDTRAELPEMVASSPEGAAIWNMQQAMRHAKRTLRGRLEFTLANGPTADELAEA